MFGRNTAASTLTFLVDLSILWMLVEFAAVPHVPAAIVAFILPTTLFYFLQREWVFSGTQRGVARGFVYFLVITFIGFAAMLATFWALLEFTGIHYLIARVAASIVYGILLFVLNGVFNFKQL